MAITAIDTILSVAGRLFALKGALSRARRDRRDRIAEYFEQVSRCLTEVSGTLKKGEVPHGKCAEMQVYATQLADTISDQVNKDEAKRLGEQLESAHEVERLLYLLDSSPDRDSELAKLDEAAGKFQGLATSIRAAR